MSLDEQITVSLADLFLENLFNNNKSQSAYSTYVFRGQHSHTRFKKNVNS